MRPGVDECGVGAGAAEKNVPRRQHTKTDKNEPADTTHWDAAEAIQAQPRRAILRGACLEAHQDPGQPCCRLDHPQGEEGLPLRLHFDELHVARQGRVGRVERVQGRPWCCAARLVAWLP